MRVLLRRLMGVAVGGALAGCAGQHHPMNTLVTKSNLASWIYSLFVQVTFWDLLVLAIVVAALALAIFWFSTRVGDPTEPAAFQSDTRLELAWIIGPALILLAITVPTVRTIIRTQPNRWPKNALTVKVIAHRWWWEFRYPQYHIQTADELHLPVNREIHFELTSADIIHSFWVPALGGKRDVIPGQVNQITLIANTPGEYYGQCAEFCGLSHANMRFRVFVQTQDGFKKWMDHQLKPPVNPGSGPAAAGAAIYKNAPCAICHQIRGVSGFSKQYTYGFRGPDLTHFGSRTTIAAGILDNNPKNLARWIANPPEVKPGARMPALGVRGKELDELVAYLESLK